MSLDYFRAFDSPQCTGETARCVYTCREPNCGEQCLQDDPNPDCARCAQNNYVQCARENGCAAAFDTYVCCLEANGCLDAPDACAGLCDRAESDACFERVGMLCIPAVLRCLPMGGGFPGPGG